MSLWVVKGSKSNASHSADDLMRTSSLSLLVEVVDVQKVFEKVELESLDLFIEVIYFNLYFKFGLRLRNIISANLIQ